MINDSVVRSDFQTGDEENDLNLRPKLLDEFLGQTKVKENLSVFIQAARSRKESMDHLFLIGPPGLGKTTLAQITARELGADFKVTSAPALDKPKDLAGILSTITEGSVFFIDEIHRLKPAIEEMLYIAMEDYELDWIIGQGAAARTVRIPIPKFTLVGATTKAGMVSSPLISRFGIVQRFNFYTNRILRRMRDFAQVYSNGVITKDVVVAGLDKLEIDTLGLERYDREILLSIINNYGGGPVGAETLAISIGESVDSLEDYYEPYLIQCGLLQRTPRGRIVTEKARLHLGLEGSCYADQRLLF